MWKATATSSSARLVDPYGRLVDYGGSSLTTSVLGLAGRYQVVVEPTLPATGTATIWDVPDDLVVPISTDGTLTTATISFPGQTARFSFQAIAGQRFFVKYSKTDGGYVDANLVDVTGAALGGGHPFISPFTLAPVAVGVGGTTQFVFRHSYEQVGAVSVQIWVLPPDGSASIATTGQSVSLAATVPGQALRLNFFATAGDLLVGKFTVSSGSTVRLVDGTGATIAIGYGGTSVTIGPVVVAQTGNHQLVVTSPDAALATVIAEIRQYPNDVIVPAVIDGGAVSGVVTVPGQLLRFRFSGPAGVRVKEVLTGTSASTLVVDSWGRTMTPGIAGWLLERTGSYDVVVTMSNASTGSVSLLLTTNGTGPSAPADISANASIGGGNVTGTTTVAGQDVAVTFGGVKGQRIAIATSGSYADKRLTSPDSTWTSANLPALATVTLPYTGQFRFLFDTGEVGTFTVNLLNLGPDVAVPIVVDGTSASASNGLPGRNTLFTFSATSGQRLNISAPGIIGMRYLTAPSGARRWVTGISGADTDRPIALTETGTYRLLIDGEEDQVAATTVLVQDIGPEVTQPLLLTGQPVVTQVLPSKDVDLAFVATAGQRVTISSASLIATRSLSRPDGSQLRRLFGTSGFYKVALKTGGTHHFYVDPEPSISGADTVSAWDTGPDATTSILFGQTKTVSNDVPGRDVVFTVQSGTTASVSAAISSTSSATLTVRRPDGRIVLSQNIFSQTSVVFPMSVVNQPYVLLVDFLDIGTGSVTLGLPAVLDPLASTVGATWLSSYFKWFQRQFADPVNSTTGSFVHGQTDLTLPGRGVPFTLTRSYDSRSSGTSALGPGWDHLYNQTLTIGTDGSAQWKPGTGGQVLFPANGTGGFVTPPGIVGTLTVAAGGGWNLDDLHGMVNKFDATGLLISQKDRSGQGLTFTYASGKLTSVSDGAGRVSQFTYGTTGAALDRLTGVATAGPRSVSFSYASVAGQPRLVGFVDALGKTTTYSYDAAGRLSSEIDQNGNTVVSNVYDAAGRVVDQTDPLGNHSLFSWNDTAGTGSMTDAAGAVQTHSSVGGAVTSTATPSGTQSMQYNPALDVTSFADALGNVWSATYDSRGNMLSRTSPLGFIESWTYDVLNNPLTHVDARGNTTTMTYDAAGRQLTEVRPLGVNLAWSWNADGTLASSTNPRGGVSLYTYDTSGNLASQVSPLGLRTTYAYDVSGRVVTITEPRGNVAGATATNFQQKFTYDATGNVLTTTDALGRLTSNVYDSAGRKTKTTEPDTGVTSYVYNAANELLSVTAPNGGVTNYQYDARGLRTTETSPTGAVTTFAYDPAGRTVSRVEPRGNVSGGTPASFTSTFTYDGEGRMLTSTDPLGRLTSNTFDSQGRQIAQVRPDSSFSMAYDQNGNLTSTTSEAGTTLMSFDALNRTVSSTDLGGKTSTFEYDAAGNSVATIDPLGRRSTSVFDADGRMTSSVDARGTAPGANPTDFQMAYTYDAAGNQLTATDPIGNTTTSTYDRVSNRASAKNPRLQTTTYTFDSMNRTTVVSAPVIGATTYAYSTMGFVTSRTDPLLRVSTWNYDVVGRETKRTDPLGRFFTTAYDIAGNTTQVVDAKANAGANPTLGSTTFTYDSLNRPLSRFYSDGTPAVSWVYDSQGRTASVTDGTGTWTYAYDAADRVASITQGADVYSYTYDAQGNTLSRTLPGGANSTAVFDDAGQMVSVADTSGTTTYTYDRIGNTLTTSLPNGVSQTRTYDRAARLATITNTGPGGPIGGFTYGRDANANPTSIDVSGPTGVIATESTRNTYDNYDELTKTCFTTTTCNTGNTTTWTYDKNGNRLTQKIGTAAKSSYTYNTADELTSITGPGAATYTYNSNGDQITAGADTFTYNTARQPTGATNGGIATTFTYDGFGNRATLTNSGVTTTEIRDRQRPLATLVAERINGTIVRKYTYGNSIEPLRFDNPANSVAGYFLADAVGSISNLTTLTGTLAATYRYDPYGTMRPATAVTAGYTTNPMRYTGQQLDPTGLYNLRARHYNPALGRFTQTDPLEATVGEPYPSSYVYGRNNPVVYTDPSGLRAERVGPGGEVPVAENPVADQAPEQLALILLQSGAQLPAKGCLPGDSLGMFVDTKWGPFGTRKTVRKVHLCGGVHKNKKGDYGLAHINAQGHFGGKLGTSLYAQGLVGATVEDGAHGDYKGGGLVINWNLPFQCRTPDFKKVVFIFNVTVSADPGDRIITAFIAKDDHLDKMDPVRMDQSCKAGKYPA